MATIQDEVNQVISEAVSKIRQIYARSAAEHIQQAWSEDVGDSGGRRASPTKGKHPYRNRKCPFPGCEKPGKGPRFSFFCEEHMGISKEKKKKYLAEQKEREGKGRKSTTPDAEVVKASGNGNGGAEANA